MDTNYPDSLDDFDTLDEENSNTDEGGWVAQELSQQAKQIEERFRNVDF